MLVNFKNFCYKKNLVSLRDTTVRFIEKELEPRDKAFRKWLNIGGGNPAF